MTGHASPFTFLSLERDFIFDYDWIIKNLQLVETPQYQGRYRKYWAMNAARLSAPWCDAYFGELRSALDCPTSLGDLVDRLYGMPTHGNGRRSLQFSFATKLLHTADRRTPIYDSFVASFYFFQPLDGDRALQDRIDHLLSFQNFLSAEYKRILENGFLASSIQAFRSKFNPQHFTDVKIVDLLIWAWAKVLNQGGLIERRIVFR
ncbi:MAG: hypothetical protein ABSB15_05990 [Bryobacteraceae bacterium]